jgi:hypothetical protein
MVIDPYFNDVPWEIIYDNDGRAIGEIYVLLHLPPTRRRKKK